MTTSTLIPISGILERDAMKFLAGCKGPCITMVIPAHHPGAREGSRKALVHGLVRTANENLTSSKQFGKAQAAELMAPLEEIAAESGIDAGGAGFAIFRSPGYTARYHLADVPAEKLLVADHFWLAPFIENAYAPHDLFVLGLSTKQLRLFRYVNGECKETPLPAGVPASLDAAGGFDKPDHALETRSASGPSNGTMRGIRVGTLSDREKFPEYLHHFFETVDRALRATLEGKPVLLMGVHQEVAAYRRVAKYPHILAADCPGNIDFVTLPDVAACAAKACRADRHLIGERVLAEYREMSDRVRTLADVPAVLQAAIEGRVHRLCVREGSELTGAKGEDLINAAVVETLRTGGEVFTLSSESMPASDPLAAILRY
jgi:hypothetical protein